MPNTIFQQRITPRVLGSILLHALVFSVVYCAAFYIGCNGKPTAEDLVTMLVTGAAMLVIKTTIFYSGGHCHRSWQTVSFSDLSALVVSASLSTMFLAAMDRFVSTEPHIRKTVLALDWGFTILLLGLLRAFVRMMREEIRPRLFGSGFQRTLIIGANQSGETLCRHLAADPKLKYQVIGFLDADRAKHGSTVNGVSVFGYPHDALRIAKAIDVANLLVISGSMTGPELRQLLTECDEVDIAIKVIPALDELISGDHSYSNLIRNVDINDLLRREPAQLSNDAINSLLAGQTVMVTGAGGSIGSEVCRQVLKFHPKQLLLVEQAENSLFLIEQELGRQVYESKIIPCIADITDRTRMEQIFSEYRPQVVFHAAAHKHVPMMEYNPGEAIKNNVVGTMQLAELSDQFSVQNFVMISTDKAVNPTSVMGASKQIAERFVHAFSEVSSTKFVAVRFGNVLASNGSVVPIFQDQIRRGGPITVTHPDIERFFMTIPEASQLVLQAASMGKGGEIFVLDMGQPVRIIDLARDLIRLSGLKEDDIEIQFTGLRPGEKLYEELYFENEEMQPTPHSKVFVAYHRPYHLAEVREMINQLKSVTHLESGEIKKAIQEWIPEYDPNGVLANRAESKPAMLTPHNRMPQRRSAEKSSSASTGKSPS